MEKFFETIIHSKDLYNGSYNHVNFNKVLKPHGNEIQFKCIPGGLVARQRVDVYSMIFDLYIDVSKINSFYYVKCFSKFPIKHSYILIELIKRSLVKDTFYNKN